MRTDTQMHKYMQIKAVLEDLKITLTEHAGILAPIAMVAAENAQAIAMLRLAFGGLRGGVVRAVVGIAGMVRATATATRNFVLYGGAARGAAAGTALLGTAARGAAAGVGMLGVALRALLVSTGIGVALMAFGRGGERVYGRHRRGGTGGGLRRRQLRFRPGEHGRRALAVGGRHGHAEELDG